MAPCEKVYLSSDFCLSVLTSPHGSHNTEDSPQINVSDVPITQLFFHKYLIEPTCTDRKHVHIMCRENPFFFLYKVELFVSLLQVRVITQNAVGTCLWHTPPIDLLLFLTVILSLNAEFLFLSGQS